ncbi:hypothetical protein TNCV_378531 [Trichonephila clavipes]|nr:hypothetical protein TNCV_378531 [Trichonephila clavipes]
MTNQHMSYEVQLQRTLLYHPLEVGKDSLMYSKLIHAGNGRGVGDFHLILYKRCDDSHLHNKQQLLYLSRVYQPQRSRYFHSSLDCVRLFVDQHRVYGVARYPKALVQKKEKKRPILAGFYQVKEQINLEMDKDDVQELLDSHNQELTTDELIEMHEQEHDIEELEFFYPVQSEGRMTVGNLTEGPIIASSITEIDKILIIKLPVVLTTIACGREIEGPKVQRILPDHGYTWYYMPQSLLKELIHEGLLVNDSILPIRQMLEEVIRGPEKGLKMFS